MKHLLFLTLIFSSSAFAHQIKGTLIGWGTAKTKIILNRMSVECKVKIGKDDIQDLTAPLEGVDPAIQGSEMKNYIEDSYGNPAYQVKAEISLRGLDLSRSISISFNKNYVFDNMFKQNDKTIVYDTDYKTSTGETMKIDDEGRILKASFIYRGQKINCEF